MLSPNIKVDVPTPAGYQTATTAIDFFTFNEVIVDGSNGVATNAPPPTVHNRVYVEAHNRGRFDAANVQVMAAITNASAGLGLLPVGYEANVVAGTNLPGPDWTTLGVTTVTDLRAGFSQIVHFDLPSTVLPLPASLPGNSHFCMVAFLHSAQDPYTSVQRNVDLLTLSDRKVAQQNLHIVQFVGTPPPPGTGLGAWAMLELNATSERERRRVDLVVDARDFPGWIHLVLPRRLFPRSPERQLEAWQQAEAEVVAKWHEQAPEMARRLYYEAKHPVEQYKRFVNALEDLAVDRPLLLDGRKTGVVHGVALEPGRRQTLFFRVDAPRRAKLGSAWEFDVQQRDPEKREILGGSRYRVVINRPMDRFV